MVDKAQINLRLEAEQKDAWEKYVEESGEFSTVTGLIRASVEREIANEQNGAGQSPALESDIGELKSDIQEIKSDVKNLVSLNIEPGEQVDLANEVRDELVTLPKPTGPVNVPDEMDINEKEYRRLRSAENIILPQDADEAKEGRNPQTLSAIGDRVGATSEEVNDAIERLKDDFIPIVEVEVDGEVHYFLER